jgi:hypothetical protein
MNSTHLNAANHVIGLRTSKKTKDNYKSKLNTIKIYLKSLDTQEVDPTQFCLDENGDIKVPLPNEVIQKLFGWLSTNTDLPKKSYKHKRKIEEENESDDEDDNSDIVDIFAERMVTISESCMQGYKSALLWLYAESNVIMDKTTDFWLNNFIVGYKKTIATKKEKGVMSITEGKSPLSFVGYFAN